MYFVYAQYQKTILGFYADRVGIFVRRYIFIIADFILFHKPKQPKNI